MNVIIWIHISLLKPHLEAFKFHLYLQDYPTHEGGNSHIAFSPRRGLTP